MTPGAHHFTKPRPNEAATFRARGVATPFTAPMLASARVRAADRGGIELVLPNPSGSAGVFITNWSGAAALRSATLHDTLLHHRIARFGAPDPRLVREAALAIAEEGYAGPAAAEAARNRRDNDAAERQRIRDAMLLRCGAAQSAQPADQVLARALGVSTGMAGAALLVCCDAVAPLGLGIEEQDARLPRMIAQLDSTAREIAAWLTLDPAHDGDGIGTMVVETLRAAAAMCQAFVDGVRAWFGDPLSLMRKAMADPQALRDQADRALWLVDGWERPGLIWLAADSTAMRRLALLEIAQDLPNLPTEALSWTDPPVSPPPADLAYRVSYGGNARLSSAAALTLIRRNETLRALSL